MPSTAFESRAPLVVHICLHEGGGGAEHYLLSLAKELSLQRPVLVVTVDDSWLAATARAADLETITVPPPRGRLSLPTVVRLARLFHARRAGVLHSHLGLSDWYTWLAGRFAPRAMLVTTEHGISTDRPELFAGTPGRRLLHRLAHRLRLKRTDAVIAVSAYTARALRQRYGAQATRTVVTIPPGLDLTRFSVRRPNVPGAATRPLGLVYVGRMEAEKGPDLLVEAADICAARGLRLALTMIGDGGLRPQLEDRVKPQRGVEYRWLGRIADPVPFLLAADVFILPSRSENLPLAVVEAMAAALPVIATDVGGVAEVVRDGETGLLVEPESPLALADAIERCYLQRDMLADMGTKGRARSQDFAIQQVGRSISALYDQILQQRGAFNHPEQTA